MNIESKIRAISQAYQRLTDANLGFISKCSDAESFRILIDQRSLISEDIEIVAKELCNETNHSFKGHNFPCSSLMEVLRALPILAPEFSSACQDLKDSLEKLVESDKNVESFIGKLRDDLKAEIQKIRKGAQGIRGYRQNQQYGSCFINKIK